MDPPKDPGDLPPPYESPMPPKSEKSDDSTTAIEHQEAKKNESLPPVPQSILSTDSGSTHRAASYNYDMLSERIMKTSNRILDDVRFDLHFLLDDPSHISILNSKTIDYYDKFKDWEGPVPYKFSYSSDSFHNYLFLQKYESKRHFIHKMKCLLVKNKTSATSLSKHKVFHLNINIKSRFKSTDLENDWEKEKYYLIKKDELFKKDADHLFTRTQIEEESLLDESQNDILNSSLPKRLIDEATYINIKSQTIIHIEIFEPELNAEDLIFFEPEGIKALKKSNTRTAEVIKGLRPSPSSADCLFSIYSSLTNCLVKSDSQDYETTYTKATLQQGNSNSSSSTLGSLYSSFVVNKLHFQENKKRCEPVSPQTFEKHSYKLIVRDWYQRVIRELIYYGVSLHDPKSKFFKFELDHALKQFYLILNENDKEVSCQHETKYRETDFAPPSFGYVDYICLSVFTFYNQGIIISNVGEFHVIDPANYPIYLQCLVNISNSRIDNNSYIQEFVATEMSKGRFPFDEIIHNFSMIGLYDQNNFDANSSPQSILQELASFSSQQIIDAYQFQLIANHKSEDLIKISLKKIQVFKNSKRLHNFIRSQLLSLDDSYRFLNVSSDADDDTILASYIASKDEFGNNFPELDISLISVATYRFSHYLLSYAEKNLTFYFYDLDPNLQSLKEEDLCRALKVDPYANEYQIINVVEELFKNERSKITQNGISIDNVINRERLDNFRRYRLYLYSLNFYKKSVVIEKYLEMGSLPSELIPLNQVPVGLNNIGNTCYLNSLLQFYFVIKPLREEILNFEKVFPENYNDEIVNNDEFKHRRIGGREVKDKEVQRSYQLTYQLRDLFYEMIHSPERDVFPTKELAYLAFSPMIQEVEFEEDNAVPEVKDDATDSIKEDATPEIDSIITKTIPLVENVSDGGKNSTLDVDMNLPQDELPKLEITVNEVYSNDQISEDDTTSSDSEEYEEAKKPTRSSTATAKISFDQLADALELGRQQDVTECVQNVLIQLEASSKPYKLEEENEQYDSIKEIFYGKTKQVLSPYSAPEKQRIKMESFLNLFVSINDAPRNIYDALDDTFQEDDVILGNENVKRSVSIIDLPKVLSIQIQRVQYDIKRGCAIKSIEPLPLVEKIFMDRYLENTNEEFLKAKAEYKILKSKLKDLKVKMSSYSKSTLYGLTKEESLSLTKDYLASRSDANPEVINFIDKKYRELKESRYGLIKEIYEMSFKIDNHFDDYKEFGYDLFAIFIHRGEATYGHYWIYIKDPVKNIYRKYNDEIVTEVSLEEVLNFSEGNTATPYFVVYAKSEFYKENIESLKRII